MKSILPTPTLRALLCDLLLTALPYLLGFLLLFGGMHLYNGAKAKRLNDVYGTHFTAWDIWMGVEKNYREIN